MALLEFATSEIPPSEVTVIRNTVESALVNDTDLLIVEREKMNKILKELKIQMSGVTVSDNAVKLGKMLNVHYLMFGDLSKADGKYFLALKVISVENARTLALKRLSGRSMDELITKIEEKVPDEFNGLATLEIFYPTLDHKDKGIEIQSGALNGHPQFTISIRKSEAGAGIYFDISKIDITYFTKIKIRFDRTLPVDVAFSLVDAKGKNSEIIGLNKITQIRLNTYEIAVSDFDLDEELEWTGITFVFSDKMNNEKLVIGELVVLP